jgi:hypothetical protein
MTLRTGNAETNLRLKRLHDAIESGAPTWMTRP